MEFLIKEHVEITWYYCPREITNEINKERTINHLSSCSEEYVKSTIDNIKSGHKFLKIEGSVGSSYCPQERKQRLFFSMSQENKELIVQQVQGLFESIIIELGKGNKLSQEDIINQANYIQEHYYKKKFSEQLNEKFPEKEKASLKKPKI